MIIDGNDDKVGITDFARKAKNIYKNVVLKEIEGADHGFAGKDDEEAIRTLLDFCKFAE
jgi:hypothetical protein